MKRILIRFLNGFCYSIAITLVMQFLVMLPTGTISMLPDYLARFADPVSAFVVQLLLIGCMSGVTSAGTVLFGAKKLSLLAQSVLFLVVMLSAWIPVSCYVWGFHKYIMSMITTVCSIVVSYGITWGIMYRLCRKDIDTINAKLTARKGA